VQRVILEGGDERTKFGGGVVAIEESFVSLRQRTWRSTGDNTEERDLLHMEKVRSTGRVNRTN
jgi:hypothetical protein